MKKVISFSVWGELTQYSDGAIRAAKMRPEFYPDWVCRFYLDKKLEGLLRAPLQDLGCEVRMEDDEGKEGMGLFWRFKPMYDDPDVERFIVRDTDSVFSLREVAAVNEWIESDLPFHIMRDNRSHNVAILGGTWGAVSNCVDRFENRMYRYIKDLKPDAQGINPRGPYHGSDQVFLNLEVWPNIKNTHLAHDEFHHFTGREKPFPVKNDNGMFIGQTY